MDHHHDGETRLAYDVRVLNRAGDHGPWSTVHNLPLVVMVEYGRLSRRDLTRETTSHTSSRAPFFARRT